MKMYMLKSFMMAFLLLLMDTILHAQFDDVYYDPDDAEYAFEDSYADNSTPPSSDTYGVTYYDDDSYDYYDDYDFYYASRIRRFHHPYSGFGFFDPAYTSYYYYDPFYSDAYYYPGSSIYISFGQSSYWDYRRWRRWNSWNHYNSWNSWCLTPYSYYYTNNYWCGGNYNYWSGYNGYYSYSNYYNNYYYGCPFPVGYNNGITHTTVNWVNSGSTRGTYYGPRITGNTGSSPRGPVHPPGAVQPVYEGKDVVASPTDKPAIPSDSGIPGRTNSSNPTTDLPVDRPASVPISRNDAGGQVTQDVPMDKELKRDDPSSARRPVFKPETERYQPYPATEKRNDATPAPKPGTDAPLYKPYTPSRTTEPAPKSDTYKPTYAPDQQERKPAYNPPRNNSDSRPSYTPPTRNERMPDYRPSSSPNTSGRSNTDRPSYTPPPRTRETPPSESRPSSPPRNNDKPSYTPRNDAPSHSAPSSSRDNSSGSNRSSSSGSTRSSSSGGNGSGSSPRGRG